MPETQMPAQRRHLAAVPDESCTAEDGTAVGLVWPPDEATEHVQEDQTDTEDPAPGRVLAPTEADTSLTPAQASTAQLTDRLKAGLEAAHTYALLAWSRRWEVAMDYVMDPQVREQMLDAAQEELETKTAEAEKAVRRSVKPEDTARANKRLARMRRREISTMEVDARVLRARTARLAGRCVVPAAVVVGPVLLATGGMWVGLLAWPAAWGWLALQGRAMARAETATTVTEKQPTPIEQRAHALAEAATGAAVAATAVGATEEENQILARLAQWREAAPRRGLDGTTAGDPTLSETGLQVVLTCSGRLTPADLIKKTSSVRALLGVPTGTALNVVRGEQGDQAVVRIRTRTPERDMTWYPGRSGIGVDVSTGQEVDLQVYHRMLIAGASRSGKTVLLRVLMAKVAADPNAHLVLIDAKQVEAARWRHVARTACTPQEISALANELKQEMEERYREISRTGQAWTPSPEHPRLVVVVDEGAEVLAMDEEDTPIMEDLRSLARMGGEAEMHLWWCTQKPTKSGKAPGIDTVIAGQMTGALVCLRTATAGEGRTVLGEDAGGGGWLPHELERAGLALIRDGERGPDPVAVWDLSDENKVLSLQPQSSWSRRSGPVTSSPGPDVEEDEEAGDKGAQADDWIGAQGAVMGVLTGQGPRTMPQLIDETGYSKTMVHNALKQLSGAGRIQQVGGRGSAWRAL